MKPVLSHTLLSIYLGIFSLIFTTGKIAQAQVTPDSSNINTQVNQNAGVVEITGGQTRGGNLFHSFQDFSVGTGNEAFFNNADNISNIFSRVTGGNISNIDGAISANGSASLFLINPAGIIFGENARLNIGGSFYGSSASSVLFEDGEFSAADLTTPPVLTINAPIGLGFRNNPGEIVNSSFLQISPSETIAFVGGDVTLNNGSIFAPGGNVEIGGLSEAGTVSIDNNTLAFPEAVERGNVSLANGSSVIIEGGGGGSININARNFELLSQSLLFAGIDEGLGTPETEGGNITINAQDNLEIDTQGNSNSTIILNANSGIGNLGDISLTARNISLRNGGFITNANLGQGDIGNINLVATDNIVLDGTQVTAGGSASGIQNIVAENSGGNVASVNITSRNLSVLNGAFISSSVAGTTDSGDINLNIADTINISGTGEVFDLEQNSITFNSKIAVEIFQNGIGNAGDININTQNITLSNNGVIDASTFGQGNAGDINITANNIDIEGGGNSTSAFSAIVSDAFGDLSDNPDAFSNGGNIQIDTNTLSLRNGGNVSASNFIIGNGNGGSISIDATDNISIDGRGIVLSEGEEIIVPSGVFASILSSDVVGKGGDITIDTPQLSISNRAQVTSFTRGEGDAGDISIFSSSIELVGNSSLSVSTEPESTGNGGNLTIETVDLTVDDASSISVLTFGEGDAGSLQINAMESIQLSGFDDNRRGGLIASALDSSGDGGDINISTNQLTISEGASITASNFPGSENSDVQPGTGEAGSINIEANSISLDTEGRIDVATQSSTGNGANINLEVAEDITLRNNSFISAQAFNLGNGGNLSIDSRFVIAFPSNGNGNGNDIIASAERGQGGNITINAESLFGISEGLIREGDNSNNINASSQISGLDGIVEIVTPDLNPLQGATELPSNVVEPGETTAQACEANREAFSKNGLNIAGKGGVIPAPDLPLEAQNIFINGQLSSETIQPIETSQGKILPARGLKITESGEVILTAYRTNNLGERVPEIKMNCGS